MHPFIRPLTAAILVLALLSAGCTDTGGGSADSPTAVATHTAIETPTPQPTDSHWYDDRPGFEEATVKTLFGYELYGIKNEAYGGASYNIFDIDTGDCILKHSDCPNFDLYSELQPEQARALEEQYGYPESVVMEQADTDGDGALDKVAVRYEGSKGVLEFETEYRNRWDLTDHLITYLNNN